MTEHLIYRRRTIPRAALINASDTYGPVVEAIREMDSEIREEAVWMNADGWQSGKMREPLMWENGWDGSIGVRLEMEMTRG